MKVLRKSILPLAFLSFGLLTACGNNAPDDASDKAYTADYVCPMHCAGSGSDEMGDCPVCGMDYVARAEHESDGHSH